MATRQAVKKALAAKKASAKQQAAAKDTATPAPKVPPPWTTRGARLRKQQQRALTRGLSPKELAARITATGRVGAVHLLSWEPIHGPGDYAAIARAFRDLAGMAFPLQRISDRIDLDSGHASLEVTLDGVRHVLDAGVRGSDVDDGVLVRLATLLEERSQRSRGNRRCFFVDPSTCKKAETYLLMCATFDDMFAINAATGAAFIKVTEL